jgi:hypothetical protein
MLYEEVQYLIDRAAELLPDPPSPGNAEGYAGWAALTLGTGCRLARILGADTDLLWSLSRDEHWTPFAWRQRRRLLLRVALYAALQAGKHDSGHAGIPRQRLVVGHVVATATPDSRLPAHRPGWLDVA